MKVKKKNDCKVIDDVMKELYCHVTDELRNIMGPFYSIADILEKERDNLPEILKSSVPNLVGNNKRYKKWDAKLSEILSKLPPKKKKEYYAYYVKKETNTQ